LLVLGKAGAAGFFLQIPGKTLEPMLHFVVQAFAFGDKKADVVFRMENIIWHTDLVVQASVDQRGHANAPSLPAIKGF
jgi:hypothetical protein